MGRETERDGERDRASTIYFACRIYLFGVFVCNFE